MDLNGRCLASSMTTRIGDRLGDPVSDVRAKWRGKFPNQAGELVMHEDAQEVKLDPSH